MSYNHYRDFEGLSTGSVTFSRMDSEAYGFRLWSSGFGFSG